VSLQLDIYPLTDYNRALQNHHVSETRSSVNIEVNEMDEESIYTYTFNRVGL
jgi:hypothetical protein